ncbi:MAG: hypothetical protein ACRC92_26930 [Peptostreptococcaceae bacterium]
MKKLTMVLLGLLMVGAVARADVYGARNKVIDTYKYRGTPITLTNVYVAKKDPSGAIVYNVEGYCYVNGKKTNVAVKVLEKQGRYEIL